MSKFEPLILKLQENRRICDMFAQNESPMKPTLVREMFQALINMVSDIKTIDEPQAELMINKATPVFAEQAAKLEIKPNSYPKGAHPPEKRTCVLCSRVNNYAGVQRRADGKIVCRTKCGDKCWICDVWKIKGELQTLPGGKSVCNAHVDNSTSSKVEPQTRPEKINSETTKKFLSTKEREYLWMSIHKKHQYNNFTIGEAIAITDYTEKETIAMLNDLIGNELAMSHSGSNSGLYRLLPSE
ncbi:MAG TPA: hypothetical protein V6C76_11675 [Drouetiella sp.]